jgi:DnaJ-class molecular chaperone
VLFAELHHEFRIAPSALCSLPFDPSIAPKYIYTMCRFGEAGVKGAGGGGGGAGFSDFGDFSPFGDIFETFFGGQGGGGGGGRRRTQQGPQIGDDLRYSVYLLLLVQKYKY